MTWLFHNVSYAIFVCSRKVRMSCFCKVGMSHSPALNNVWEIADGIDCDERARAEPDQGFGPGDARSQCVAAGIKERIARAAPAARFLDQDSALHQIADVAQRRIGRAFLNLCPFAGGQLAAESVYETHEHIALPLIEPFACVLIPELRLGKHL